MLIQCLFLPYPSPNPPCKKRWSFSSSFQMFQFIKGISNNCLKDSLLLCMPKLYIKSLLIKFADNTVIGSMINNNDTAIIQSNRRSQACSITTCTHTITCYLSHLCTMHASNLDITVKSCDTENDLGISGPSV